MATAGQSRLDVEVIRQYPGGQQVARKVKVQVPGKHSPPLQLGRVEVPSFFARQLIRWSSATLREQVREVDYGFVCDLR